MVLSSSFDSDPVFGSLLDPMGGSFLVGSADGTPGVQRYIDNTNVLETTFEAPGGRFRVVDFAPRFEQHARMFRPTSVFRLLEPLEGSPRIVVRCDPVLGWSKAHPAVTQGSNHLQYEGYASTLRLTTDIPVVLDGRLPLSGGTGWRSRGARRRRACSLVDLFLSETIRHWQRWVKPAHPPRYQRDVFAPPSR